MDTPKPEENSDFKIRLEDDLPDHKESVVLDDLDREILESHIKDVFFSYNDLADKWGVTGATIRNRVNRLKALGVMNVILVMNPYKIGYSTFAIIGIKTDSSTNVDSVASALLSLPGVTEMMMVAGRFDFFIHYVCRNTDEYHRFIVESLKKIPGIANVESFMGLDIYSRKFEIGVTGPG